MEDYCQNHLPPETLEKLQAAAFRSLCRHLQERSDLVPNMELMTLSGFCRNCLAKWMVLEARQLVDRGEVREETTQQALNALGYEEAAQHVYGMSYGDWKKRHQKKATDEQLERYNASKDLQAVHDKELLASRGDPASVPKQTSTKKGEQVENEPQNAHSRALLSDVCCQDVDEPVANVEKASAPASGLPSNLPPKLRIAVLTVSDRASKNEYPTGDLSGPAVVQAVHNVLSSQHDIQVDTSTTSVVPDQAEAIQSQLESWCQNDEVHVILTTGGTGFGRRDVTPEATRAVLHQELPGLMPYVTTECSVIQPLASLSRGTAGIRAHTLIANLPGNPKGVTEVVPVLLPVLLHAVADLHNRRGSGGNR